MSIEKRYNRFSVLMNTGSVKFKENFNNFKNQFNIEEANDLAVIYRLYYVYLLKRFVYEKKPGFDPKSTTFPAMINASISNDHKSKSNGLVNFVVMKLKKENKKEGRASTFLGKRKETKGKEKSLPKTKLQKLKESMMKKKGRIEKEAKKEVEIKRTKKNPLIGRATKKR